MERNKIARTVALLAVCAQAALFATAAHASATVDATLSGSGTYFDYFNQCTPAPDSPYCLVSWSGDVSATLSSSADGTYTGASLQSLTFDSNWTVENFHAGDTQTFYDFGPVGAQPGTSVTLSGGRITGIEFAYDDVDSHLTVDGLSAHAWSDCRDEECEAFSSYDVAGTLTSGSAPAVPEPSNLFLLLAGLGLAAARRRRS